MENDEGLKPIERMKMLACKDCFFNKNCERLEDLKKRDTKNYWELINNG